MTHTERGNRRYGVLARFGALIISFGLVACTADPTPGVVDSDVTAVEAGDVVLVSTPDSLMHYSEAELMSTMGEPEFVWQEAGASMWRYDSSGCSVFVYLYSDGVRHVDIRGEGMDAAQRRDCFHNLMVDRPRI